MGDYWQWSGKFLNLFFPVSGRLRLRFLNLICDARFLDETIWKKQKRPARAMITRRENEDRTAHHHACVRDTLEFVQKRSGLSNAQKKRRRESERKRGRLNILLACPLLTVAGREQVQESGRNSVHMVHILGFFKTKVKMDWGLDVLSALSRPNPV